MTLNEYKEVHKLKSSDLATLLGIHESQLCRYLKGKTTPSLQTARSISDKTNGQVGVDSWIQQTSIQS